MAREMHESYYPVPIHPESLVFQGLISGCCEMQIGSNMGQSPLACLGLFLENILNHHSIVS